ncbi:hypothetical protein [Gordonia paraffinivorans]|uniref:hypothetical protein n=1 Tax=Gordonia paraffinivorans TaxID=175628 RepID=UPI003FCDEF9D
MNGTTVNQAVIAVPAVKPIPAFAAVSRTCRTRSWIPAVCARPASRALVVAAAPAVARRAAASAQHLATAHPAAAQVALVAPPAAEAAAPAPHGFPVPTPILRS